MPSSRKEAAERYRKRMKRGGWVRCEVRVRTVAAFLNGSGRLAAARALLCKRFGRAPDLKRLLLSAPLEGIDLERSRAPGREIDL